MKETKRELRDRIEELEWEHRVLAREGIENEQTIAKRDAEIEQLKGQAKLAAIQHGEEVAELAAAARRSQAAYEATQSERQPVHISGVLPDAIESSVRMRLEALDAVAEIINPRWRELHGEDELIEHPVSLRDRAAHLFARWDDERDEHARLLSTYSQLTATVQAAYGFIRSFGPFDITAQRMAEEVTEWLEENAAELTRLQQIIGAVHDRVVGTDRSELTPAEQLVEIGDVGAATKRALNDASEGIAREQRRNAGMLRQNEAQMRVLSSQRAALEQIIETAQEVVL